MKNQEFKKGIREVHEMRLTEREKAAMLAHVFSMPIRSPYSNFLNVFSMIQRPMIATFSLLVIVLGGTLTYGAENALPGEVLYPIKTRFIEPVIDTVSFSPVAELEWEEKKVERRIMEAEALAQEDKLDEEKTIELERRIQKSSAAFAVAAEKNASTTATTTQGREVEFARLKQKFLEKLNDGEDAVATGAAPQAATMMMEVRISDDASDSRGKKVETQKDKIKRLKASAMKALESKQSDDEDDRKGRNSGRDREDD
jgi:hypothetical protein